MNIFKSLKCIYLMIKCSKYLYFIKKALCAVILVFSAVTVLGLFCDEKEECKKLVSKIKSMMA